MLNIQFLHSDQSFSELSDIWEALLSRSATNTPFQQPDYLNTWWSTLGGGEWDDGELWLGVGKRDDGEIVGIAPLFFRLDRDGRPSILLVGSVEVSDYLDFIVSESTTEEFVDALLGSLDVKGPAGWEVIHLYNLPEGSSTIQALERSAAKRGWRVEKERISAVPFVALGDSWDAYLQELNSKQRKEVKRKLRRAEEYPARVSWRIVDRDSPIEPEIDLFLKLMQIDSEKRAFLSDGMLEFFRRLALTAHERGWLQLAFLEVGGEPVFGYLNFDYEDKIWVYNSGFNPSHYELSPGWVLMAHLIHWAIDQGFTEVDFLRGDESYKYRLGGVDRHIVRLTIER
ncbi:MAG: GNAT family N-acetyltransferase [Anaerolineales bacterium]|nr:GNAT family N-acetyltransferase [Anaerolineales bacterium]